MNSKSAIKESKLKYQVTYIGIHKWTRAMFEKFGWMLLAKRNKHELKLEAYKESIQHLMEAIEERYKVTKCPEKKQDLVILLGNVKTLWNHVKSVL